MSKQRRANKHLIKKQIINIRTNITDKRAIADMQQRVLHVYKTKIAPRMDKILSRLVPADVFITLDKLKINLGQISIKSLEQDIAKKVEQEVKKQIIQSLREQGVNIKDAALQGADNELQRAVSKRQILQTFMQEGRYPSWASTENANAQTIMLELLEENPKAVQTMMARLAKRPEVQKRLFLQFEPEVIGKILALLYDDDYKTVEAQLAFLQKRIQKQYPASSRKRIEKLVQAAALDFYTKSTSRARKFKYKEREFNQAIIEKVQESYETIRDVSLMDYRSKVKPAFAKDYQDLDVLEYFLRNGSIPAWAEVSAKITLQEIYNELVVKQLASLQRMVERNIGQESFVQRLLMQFSEEQVLKLLEPISGDTSRFIEQSISALEIFSRSRPKISRSISPSRARETVLQTALEYAFVRKKANFVKQTFLQDVLENLAVHLASDENILLEELIAEKNQPDSRPFGEELETVLETLKTRRDSSQIRREQQLSEAIAEAEELETQIQELQTLLRMPDLGSAQTEQIQSEIAELQKQFNQIEKKQLSRLNELSPPEGQKLALEWLAIQNQLDELKQKAASQSGQSQLIQAADQTEQRMQERLPILMDLIEKTLAQPKTIERTLKLQRLNKEFLAIINYLETKQNRTQKQIQSIEAEIRAAKSSREKQLLRQQREKVEKTLLELQTQLAQLNPKQTSLQKTINELTRITMKDGEDLEGAGEATEKPETRSKMDYLVFFLEYAAVPWWADAYKNEKIEDIFSELAQNEPQTLRRNFAKIGRNPAVWQRLIAQLSEPTIEKIVRNLYPAQVDFVEKQLFILDRIQMSTIFPVLNEVPAKELKWAKLVEILLTKPDLSKPALLQNLIKILALDYNLRPSALMQVVKNLDNNVPEAGLEELAQIAEQLQQDEELQLLELDLARQATRKKLIEKGTRLSDVEKLTILQQYIALQRIPEEALREDIDSHPMLEKLFFQQMDSNPNMLRGVIFELMKTPRNRAFLSKTFSEQAYWDSVQLISRTAVLVAQSYLQTLSTALKDQHLHYEKELTLDFAMESATGTFEPKAFIQFLLKEVAQTTGRNLLALTNDWKRKVQNLPFSQRDNSLLVNLMQVEIEQLKRNESLPDIAQQIQSLVTEYSQASNVYIHTQQRESIELQGIPEEEVALGQVYQILDVLRGRLKEAEQEILQTNQEENPLAYLSAQNKKSQLEAQIKLVSRKEPAVLRLMRQQYKEAAQAIQQAEAEIQQLTQQEAEEKRRLESAVAEELSERLEEISSQPTTPAEPISAEQILAETEQIEQPTDWQKMGKLQTKASLFAELEQLTESLTEPKPEQLERLLPVLEKLVADNQNNEALDWSELSEIAEKAAKREDLRPILEKITPELRKNPIQTEQAADNLQTLKTILQPHPQFGSLLDDLGVLQEKLYKNLKKAEISELQSDWQQAQQTQEQLMRLVDKDKKLSDNEQLLDVLLSLDELQVGLYRQIRREQERRQTQELKQIQQNQKRWLQSVKKAQTVEELSSLEQQLTQTESEEIEKIAQLQSRNEDKNLQAEFGQLQKTIRRYYKQLRRRFIQQKMQMLQKQQQAQKQKISQQQQLQTELDEERKDMLKAQSQDPEEEAKAIQAEEEAKKQRERRKIIQRPRPVEEPLVVKNAGLVLLSPFLTRFFDALQLVKNKFFVSDEAQYKAVHLLQYLATKQLETPENELVLNKIMVGLPVSAPVPLSVEISQPEIDFCESLLQGAINNWARMKNISPDALRGTFIIRNGTIKEEADRWKLTVEKGSFDMLLRTISWGFTFVRYSWMEKSLFVEWNYM